METKSIVRILTLSAFYFVETTVALGQWQTANGSFTTNISSIGFGNNLIFVGTNDARVFKSDDDGDSWFDAGRLGSSSLVSVLAVQGHQSGLALASTSTFRGVYRSTDNGYSWTSLTSFAFNAARCLIFTQSGFVLAGVAGGVVRSTNSGDSWSVVYIQSGAIVGAFASSPSGYTFSATALGIRRSSNEGLNWSVADSSLLNVPFSSIACNSAGTVYAGGDSGVYRSTNDGQSWTRIYVQPVSNMTVSPSGVIVASISATNVIVRSSDAGGTWQIVPFVPSETPQRIAFNSSNKLFVGATNAVFISTNFGNSWIRTGATLDNKNIATLGSTNGDHLFVTVPTLGVYRSLSANTWARVNSGLTSLDVRAIASNDVGARMFAATFGAGMFTSTNLGVSWSAANNGITDINLNSVAAKTPAIIFAAGTTGLFRSLDTGATWSRLTGGLSTADFTCITGKNTQPLFVGTSGLGVFRSTDNGATWSEVNSGLLNLNIRSVVTFSNGYIFAATQAGTVFRSTNQGILWTPTSTGLNSTDTRMLVATATDILLAATHVGIFSSTNNGDSWTSSNEGLTNTNINCLTSGGDGFVYAGTNGNGVFKRAYDVIPPLVVSHRWMSLGSLQSWYASTGCEIEEGRILEQQDGLRWPADRRHQDMEASKGFWIGATNFTDQNGVFYSRKVVHTGPRVSGIGSGPEGGFFPIKHELVNRLEQPLVFVDNVRSRNPTIDDFVDRVDSAMKWDQMIVNVANTSLGLTMTRNIYQFSHAPHDNYIVYDYEFKNTGNVDTDPFIELPNHTLDSVYVFFQYKYAISKEGCYVMGNSSRWGINTMLDTRGDGTRPDPPNEQFRAQYAWHGKYPLFTRYDNLGAPIWDNPFFDQGDTIGRLASAQFVGVVTLHAERSATDTTDDPAQPRTTTYKGSDDPLNSRNDQYTIPGMINEYNWMKEGHASPRHAWVVQPDGRFNEPTGDPSLGTSGGWNAATGYGPYRLLPGETIRIVIAEAASGLSREATISVGRKFKQGLINARAKNDSVLTGKDSLFQTFRRAIGAYISGFNIGEPPRPPRSFRVTSGNSNISLAWESPSSLTPPVRGFKIYRTTGKFDDLYSLIHTATETSRSYTDTTVVAGVAYFYYIVSVGDSLSSSRFHAQTYYPAFLLPNSVRTTETGIPDEYALGNNFPNPFNPTTTITFAIPALSSVRLTMYDILGREISTLVSGTYDPGYYKAEWNGMNVGSGVYFYRLEARALDGTQAYTQTQKSLLIK